MRKMKRATNILSLWHWIFLFPCKIYFDHKIFKLFRANKAEEGAQNRLKPMKNKVLKLKTTKNIQFWKT
jgi:hypothetical protein